jgi:hypothetical protein
MSAMGKGDIVIAKRTSGLKLKSGPQRLEPRCRLRAHKHWDVPFRRKYNEPSAIFCSISPIQNESKERNKYGASLTVDSIAPFLKAARPSALGNRKLSNQKLVVARKACSFAKAIVLSVDVQTLTCPACSALKSEYPSTPG